MKILLNKLLFNSKVFGIEKEQLKLHFLSHPEYGSVRAITDTLDYFGIDNIAANVPKDSLTQLPEHFLAIIENEGISSIVFIIRKKGQIQGVNENNRKSIWTLDAFKKIWTGTLIAVEEEQTKKWNLSFLNFKHAIVLGFLSAVLSMTLIPFDYVNTLYVLSSVVGLVLGVVIIREELGIHNKAVAKVCSVISSQTGCADIIKTSKKILFNTLSLSDITLTYFIGIVFILGTIEFRTETFYIFTSITIPAIVYALYYQGFKLKKWCVLCLGVSAVLITQWSLFVFSKAEFILNNETGTHIVKSSFLMAGSLMAWIFLKPILHSERELEKTKTAFLKFKRNPKLFQTLFSGQELKNNNPLSIEHRITFGNSRATLQITSVMNPFCGFCTAAFMAYDQLIKNYKKDIKLDIIFLTSEDHNNLSTKIVLKIIEQYQSNKEAALETLRTWFHTKNVKLFQHLYKDKIDPKLALILKNHKDWCTLQHINYTPATLINWRFFPQEYEVKDILLFIEDLLLGEDETEENKNLVSTPY